MFIFILIACLFVTFFFGLVLALCTAGADEMDNNIFSDEQYYDKRGKKK